MRKQHTPANRPLGTNEPDRYTLMDNRTLEPLSTHPNVSGCKLSSLFHVQNGDKVYWEDEPELPVTVAYSYGVVGGERRFRIVAL